MWKYESIPNIDNFNAFWNEILNKFEILKMLKEVPQDHKFHQEGDVLTHTKMVIQALFNLEVWSNLSEYDKSLLFLAALFHDIGKLTTTKFESDGIITSRNHSIVGEKFTRQILWKGIPTPIPFFEREKIVKMVRFHGIPLNIFLKNDPQKTSILISQFVNNYLLSKIAEADVLGRICKDSKSLLYQIDLFRELCKENNCLYKPFIFKSENQRYNYFNSNRNTLDYVPFDDFEFEVILMSGLPGSGKDYFINSHFPDWQIVSLDDIRNDLKISPTDNQGIVIQEAKKRAKEFMRCKKNFIFNATSITKELRSVWINLFLNYKAKTKIIYLETIYEELFIRNKSRQKSLPEEVIEKLINKLEIPDITEAHAVEYVIQT